MSIDTRIRDHLRAEAAAVPPASGDLDAVLAPRHRSGTRLAAWATVATAAVAAIILGWGLLGPPDPTTPIADPPLPEPTGPDWNVFRAGPVVPAFEDAPMRRGRPAPEPTFDTETLGSETVWNADEPMVADPDAVDGPTLYLGDVLGQSAFVNWSRGPACLWVGPNRVTCDETTVFSLAHPAPSGAFAAWIGVPEEASVVALATGGEFIGWHRPVGGVALLPAVEGVDHELVVFSADGTEVARSAPIRFDLPAAGPGPTTSLPSGDFVVMTPAALADTDLGRIAGLVVTADLATSPRLDDPERAIVSALGGVADPVAVFGNRTEGQYVFQVAIEGLNGFVDVPGDGPHRLAERVEIDRRVFERYLADGVATYHLEVRDLPVSVTISAGGASLDPARADAAFLAVTEQLANVSDDLREAVRQALDR